MREIVEQARQRFNAGELEGYLALYAPGIRVHGASPEPWGLAELTGFYRMIYESMGELGQKAPRLEFHEIVEQGALYVCRFTMTGHHQGTFMGIPATQKPYVLNGITILRFDGDKVVERWSSADMLGLMIQLGAIPAPA